LEVGIVFDSDKEEASARPACVRKKSEVDSVS
jgi:hypothetical protein